MEVVPFHTPGLGDQSYLLVHDGWGVLVDPQRDLDRFLEAAAARDVELRFVLETHLHNDYASGAPFAAARTGAQLVLPAGAAPEYGYTPAFHHEDITARGLTLRPLHTPGHSPEHTSYLVLLEGEPAALFSGGSLLVASAGRTDLLGPARARTLARLQHQSLRRLAGLPREVALYPTHGQGSYCTATPTGRVTSTVGEEDDTNPLLAVSDAEEFADQMLADPLPVPRFYQHMGPLNLRGAPPMPSAQVPELHVDDLADQSGDPWVVDVRPRTRLADGYRPGAIGIALGDDFGSWVAWLLPYQAPLVLVADTEQDVAEAVQQLARVGFDTVRGVVRALGDAATAQVPLLDTPTAARWLDDPATQLLDVRMPTERRTARLPQATERFLPDLVTDGVPEALDTDRPVLVACASGRRSAIGATLLARAGYQTAVLHGAGVPELAEAVQPEGAR